MITSILFSHRCRIWGIMMTLLGFFSTFLSTYGEIQLEFLELRSEKDSKDIFEMQINFTDEIACLILVVGLLLLGFSAEKQEDERISQIRLNALQWAMYLHYILLAVSVIFIHGLIFLNVLFLNVFLPLIIFVIRFRWVIFRENRRILNEK